MDDARSTGAPARPAGSTARLAPPARRPGGQRAVMSERDVAILRSLADRIDPTDAGAWNNLGVVFFQKGLVEDAVAAFERALSVDVRLDVARTNAEIALSQSGYYRRRVRDLEAQLRAHPDDDEARDALARTHLLGGYPAAAAEEWQSLLSRRPGSVDLHLRLARAEADAGQLDRAASLLERASELAPAEPHVHLALAELLIRDAAYPQAEVAATRALALAPELATGHALHGRILEALGRPADARAALDRAEALDPDVIRRADNLSLERYRSASSARGRGTEAARAHAARSTEPVDAPLGSYARAAQMRRAGDLEGAARQLERAGTAGADAYEVTLGLAEVKLLQGAFEEAVRLYDRLVQQRADSPKIWNERGVALHRLGRLDRAIESYHRAVALDHTYLLGWSNLGVARVQHGDTAAGERALRHAAGDAAPPEVLGNLALYLLRNEDATAAVEVSRRAVERDESSARSWCRLGSALFQAGRAEDAREALLQALELDEEDAEARYQLGFVLSAVGDFKGALRETKRALEIDPVYPAPRYRLLLDVEFEEGALAAPEKDGPQRLLPGVAIPDFQFEPEALQRAFDQLTPMETGPPPELDGLLDAARRALRRGQLSEAVERAARAVAVAPSDPSALTLQGQVYLRRGLAGEALERFDAVLAGNPSDGPALMGRARALLELERHDEAARAAEAAGRAGAGGAAELEARALLAGGAVERAVAVLEAVLADAPGPAALALYGETLLASGRPTEAGGAFQRSLEDAPGAVSARVGLAVALQQLGRAADSEREYRQAVESLPSYGPAALGLAELIWPQGRTQEALRVLVDFLALDGSHVMALVRLGTWLGEAGRAEQGAVALRRALRLEPQHDEARAALARLTDRREA
jgi:cellulose synthase operon protein C